MTAEKNFPDNGGQPQGNWQGGEAAGPDPFYAMENRVAELESANAALLGKIAALEEAMARTPLAGGGPASEEINRKMDYLESRLSHDNDLAARLAQLFENSSRINDARIEELGKAVKALYAKGSMEQSLFQTLNALGVKVEALSRVADALGPGAEKLRLEVDGKLHEVSGKAAELASAREDAALLRKQFDELNRNFANRMEERIRASSSMLMREMDDTVKTLKTEVVNASSSSAAERLESAVASMRKRMDELDARVSRAREEADAAMRRELSSFSDSVREQLLLSARELKSSVSTDVLSRLDSSSQRADTLARAVSSLTERLSDMESRIALSETAARAKMAEAEARMAKVSELASGMGLTVSREVSSAMQRGAADIARCSEAVAQLSARLDEMQRKTDARQGEAGTDAASRLAALEARVEELNELSYQTVSQVKMMLNSAQGGWEEFLALPSHVKNMGVEMSYVANKLMRIQMRMDEFEARFGQFLVASKQISMERQNFVDYLKAQLGHTANLLTRLEDERNSIEHKQQ